MCTRYFLSKSNPELKSIIEDVIASPLSRRFINIGKPIKIEGEIRPTDVVPVLAPNPRGEKKVFPMKWGYKSIHKDGKLLLNARSETASVKPTFKYDWLNHRCIIPASYYYEWAHIQGNDGTIKVGDRYMIQPAGEVVTWLCGLYHIEDNIPTFVILTREPGSEVAEIHDRMPLILPTSLTSEWIRLGADPGEIIKEAITDVDKEKG
ncbi:Putative SOS response-associated peptidase YedK [Lachnospiraceae bacterium]|nr:Putative SOS response-associated peptidase YedK [Lachnospiraceae bacterium]